MSRDLRWKPIAESDLSAIWQYRANYDLESADRLIERLYAAPERLRDFPLSAPIRTAGSAALRGLSTHGFVLFYVFDETSVTIMRVFDARQDWLRLVGK